MTAKQPTLVRRVCLGSTILLVTAFAAHADVITDWNQTATRATEIAGAPVPVQTRAMAMVHAAIFDAVNAVESKYDRYAVEVVAAQGASAEAAAAAAAHGILERLFPVQKAMIDAALASSLKEIADGPARIEGIRVGREVAEKLFALMAFVHAAIFDAATPLRANMPVTRSKLDPLRALPWELLQLPPRTACWRRRIRQEGRVRSSWSGGCREDVTGAAAGRGPVG